MAAMLLFGPSIPDDITSLSWIAFALVWLVSAFFAKRYARRGSWGLGIRIFIIFAVVFLYQSFAVREFLFKGQGYVLTPAIQWLGAVLCACGIAFAIWARFNLGRNWGMPMSLKQDAELVTSGPYRYVRHPIYSGMMLAMLGTTLVIIWWVVPLICFFFYFVWAAKTEEGIMTKEFPTTYPDYMKRSKMLIPFIF